MSFANHFFMPDGIYGLSHSAGCQPRKTQDYLQHHALAPWKTQGECWDAWFGVIDDFRTNISRILNADASDICPISNVSEGFHKFLTSLPTALDHASSSQFSASDASKSIKNTVLIHENAFPSMGFVVQALKAQGYKLELIDANLPANDPAVWKQHIKETTLAALITHVHSNTGARSDIKPITDICKENGVYAVIDVAQSVCVMPIDIQSWGASAVIGSSLKWLCGGAGAGFIWIDPHLLPSLSPQSVGWFSHQNPFAFDIKHFEYANDANRFWGGTPSILPYAAANAGCDTMLEIGLAKIHRHNDQLKTAFLKRAQLETHFDGKGPIGGTLCLTFPTETINRIEQTMEKHTVHFDRRGDTLRLSFHIYNTLEEAHTVADMVNSCL
jgi:selenocysteine lyase/cysteine desulfurase